MEIQERNGNEHLQELSSRLSLRSGNTGAELPGKQKRISTFTGTSSLNGMRKRKCCGGGVLENVHKKMRDADFVLLCKGESVPCHKVILAGASPVFDAMLGNKKNKEAV